MVFAALAAMLVFAAPVAAAKPGAAGSDWSWSAMTNSEYQSPVEQQSDYPWPCANDLHCVVNPTTRPCSWDVDDHWHDHGYGTVAAYGSVIHTSCQVLDADPQYACDYGTCRYASSFRGRMDVYVAAPSPDLVVTISWPALGRTFTLPAQGSGRSYLYEFCGRAVFADGDPVLYPISGSNGSVVDGSMPGLGVQSDVLVAIANPTGHKVQSISAAVRLDGVGTTGNACSTNGGVDWNPMRSYPFEWTWGG